VASAQVVVRERQRATASSLLQLFCNDTRQKQPHYTTVKTTFSDGLIFPVSHKEQTTEEKTFSTEVKGSGYKSVQKLVLCKTMKLFLFSKFHFIFYSFCLEVSGNRLELNGIRTDADEVNNYHADARHCGPGETYASTVHHKKSTCLLCVRPIMNAITYQPSSLARSASKNCAKFISGIILSIMCRFSPLFRLCDQH